MMLTIAPFWLAVEIYTFLRIRRALRWFLTGASGKVAAKLLGLIYIWWSLFPLVAIAAFWLASPGVQRLLLRGHPLLDRTLVYPFWIGLIFCVEVFPLLLLLDAAKLIGPHFADKMWIQSWHMRLTVLVTALMFVYIPTRAFIDTYSDRVVERVIGIPNLPPALDGLRIVHFSDFQGDERTRRPRMEAYIRKINALRPDLVLFTGDLITHGRENIPAAAFEVGKIRAPLGVYACLGDHDLWTDARAVQDELRNYRVVFLQDTTVNLQKDGATIALTGVTQIYQRKFDPSRLTAISTNGTASLRLFMAHQPGEELMQAAAKSGYQLLFAGHTHGGQVVFWNWFWPFTPGRFESRYWRGFHRIGDAVLSINNGLGFTFAPLRYHAPASINLIVLKRVQSSHEPNRSTGKE